jgi:hypothetical protein
VQFSARLTSICLGASIKNEATKTVATPRTLKLSPADIFDFIERLKSISKAEKITMHEVIVKDQSKLELGRAVNLHRYLLRNFANTTKVVEFKTTVLNPPPEEAPNKAALLIDIPLE